MNHDLSWNTLDLLWNTSLTDTNHRFAVKPDEDQGVAERNDQERNGEDDEKGEDHVGGFLPFCGVCAMRNALEEFLIVDRKRCFLDAKD